MQQCRIEHTFLRLLVLFIKFRACFPSAVAWRSFSTKFIFFMMYLHLCLLWKCIYERFLDYILCRGIFHERKCARVFSLKYRKKSGKAHTNYKLLHFNLWTTANINVYFFYLLGLSCWPLFFSPVDIQFFCRSLFSSSGCECEFVCVFSLFISCNFV